MLNGPIAYENDIDRLRDLPDLGDTEKEIVRRIFVLGFEAAEKDGREDQAWVYQRLLRRLLLAQALDQPIQKNSAPIPPAVENPAPKLANSALVPVHYRYSAWLRDNAIALGVLVAASLEDKMRLAGQTWFRRASGTAWKSKVSPRGPLAITAVALLLIPIAYFGAPRGNTAKETPNYTNPTPSHSLPSPDLTSSIFPEIPFCHHSTVTRYRRNKSTLFWQVNSPTFDALTVIGVKRIAISWAVYLLKCGSIATAML
jgi:hypothetical protein